MKIKICEMRLGRLIWNWIKKNAIWIAIAIPVVYAYLVVDAMRIPYVVNDGVTIACWAVIAPILVLFFMYRAFIWRNKKGLTGREIVLRFQGDTTPKKRFVGTMWLVLGIIWMPLLAAQSIIWLLPYPTTWFAKKPYRATATFVSQTQLGKRYREIQSLLFVIRPTGEEIDFSLSIANSANNALARSLQVNATYCLIGRQWLTGILIERVEREECL